MATLGWIFEWLTQIFDQHSDTKTRCNKALVVLRMFYCVKFRFRNNVVVSFTIEAALRNWCRGRLSRVDLEAWAVAASFFISRCCQIIDRPNLSLLGRNILPHVRSSVDFLLSASAHSKRVLGPDDPLSQIVWHLQGNLVCSNIARKRTRKPCARSGKRLI
jgi:hypothetical protein